jgi:hypothetical protein
MRTIEHGQSYKMPETIHYSCGEYSADLVPNQLFCSQCRIGITEGEQVIDGQGEVYCSEKCQIESWGEVEA